MPWRAWRSVMAFNTNCKQDCWLATRKKGISAEKDNQRWISALSPRRALNVLLTKMAKRQRYSSKIISMVHDMITRNQRGVIIADRIEQCYLFKFFVTRIWILEKCFSGLSFSSIYHDDEVNILFIFIKSAFNFKWSNESLENDGRTPGVERGD